LVGEKPPPPVDPGSDAAQLVMVDALSAVELSPRVETVTLGSLSALLAEAGAEPGADFEPAAPPTAGARLPPLLLLPLLLLPLLLLRLSPTAAADGLLCLATSAAPSVSATSGAALPA